MSEMGLRSRQYHSLGRGVGLAGKHPPTTVGATDIITQIGPLRTEFRDHFCKSFRILFVRNVAALAKDYQA